MRGVDLGTIRYLGHSFFEITMTGLDGRQKTLLVDPWIGNPLSPVKLDDFKGSHVDYIFVTHDHGDHLGDVEELARVTGATVVAVYEIAELLNRRGVKTIGGNIGGRLRMSDLEVVLTPAIHSSHHGVPTGVYVGGLDMRVYHAGDTGLFSEMSFIGELYGPDIALLPIGGHFTMGIREAVKAVELIKPKVAIPMHYNTFPVIEVNPYEFKRLVEERTGVKVVVLKPGEVFRYP